MELIILELSVGGHDYEIINLFRCRGLQILFRMSSRTDDEIHLWTSAGVRKLKWCNQFVEFTGK